MKSRIPTFIFGAVIPITAVLFMMPWYNRVTPYVLGFPFGYFWIFLWLFLTSGCLFIAYMLDPYNKAPEEKNAGE